MERPHFESIGDYAGRFTDVACWRLYVEAIYARHNLRPCRTIRAGLPGTHPVFIVDDRYVVKLFTDLFNGAQSFAVESAVYVLLAAAPEIPAPSLLARGTLFPEDGGWPWPYLVSSVIPGVSLGAVRARVLLADQLALAAALGPIVRRIHMLLVEQAPFPARSWDPFVRLLHRRRAACAGDYARTVTMPRRLIDQIDGYLPPIDKLIDRARQPLLLHCDLNGDHVLGTFEQDRWQTTGIIDFGDAKAGDPLYELVALHLGLFLGNKGLLRAFLDSYGGWSLRRESFSKRAMALTLLHEFTVLDQIFEAFPQACEARSLHELAALLWDLDQPGLSIIGSKSI